MESFETSIADKIHLTKDVISLSFKKPYGFTHEAGQFIQLYIPQEGQQIPRSYSITTLPEEETIGLCVKILPDGLGSQFLHRAIPGDHVRISPARGRFTLKKDSKAVVCIGTGVGAAPLLPILREAKKQGKKTTMLFGLRHETDIFWEKELSHHADSITITLSQPPANWQGATGRVTDHIDRFISKENTYYLCGSVQMVRDIKNTLSAGGILPGEIHFEIFDT